VPAVTWCRASDDGDGDEASFGGDTAAGPFLFGRWPCMVDMLCLPWLERLESRMSAAEFEQRWPAVSRMMSAARRPGVCSYSEIGCDRESLTGITFRFNPEAIPPPPSDVVAAIATAQFTTSAARHDAASRLCANHAAILNFALRGRGMGSQLRDADVGSSDVKATLDDGLRMVAAWLLLNLGVEPQGQALGKVAVPQSVAMQHKHGEDLAKAAGGALLFLSRNVGVPRDMAAAPAFAFRTHLTLAALLLTGVGSADTAVAVL